jgi:hypothetical protein
MTDSRLAYDPDRLPWLSEDRAPRRERARAPLLLWALLAALLVAGVSYWLGMQSASVPDEPIEKSRSSPPAATVKLPAPAIAPPSPREVEPAPMPDVKPVAEPAPLRIAPAEPVRKAKVQVSRRAPAKAKARTVSRQSHARVAPVKKPAPAARRPTAMPVWPASVSEGARGRVVRIGAYGTRRQAKLGWWKIVRQYPGMRRLNAVVAPVKSRSGRTYYRLQYGTTSQAHSEVLCQRMRTIARSCAVIGLPRR